MDKAIKKIIKKTKNIEKSEKSLLKEDKKHDKLIAKARHKLKVK